MRIFQKAHLRGAWAFLFLATTLAVFTGLRSGLATRAASGDWSTYLGGSARTGFNAAETIITPTTAKNLKVHWVVSAGSAMSSEPVEANGHVYWGGWDGREHAANPATGEDEWTQYLGQTSSCQQNLRGVLSTATIATVSIKGATTSVDFVGGGDANLYALDAVTGAIIWITRLGTSPDHFLYSSPIYYQGSVYIGVASYNDCPDIQGELVQLDAASGTILHTYFAAPSSCTGGAVWGSPAIDAAAGKIYFATGDGDSQGASCNTTEPQAVSLIELNAANLSFVDDWQIPASSRLVDGDFGSTPTLFQATINGVVRQMVGLINKNGFYYAFDRTDIGQGPLWQVQLALPGTSPEHGLGSIASSSWDGNRLYVGGEASTVNGVSCGGDIQALNPASGAIIWQHCLKKSVVAPVTSMPGLVVVDTGNSMLVLSSNFGKTLFAYHEAGGFYFWGAASISNGVIYQGNMDGNVYAFGL